MSENNRRKDEIKEGFKVGLPLTLGYFPVAMAFGLLAKNTGISFRDTGLFSMMVFAGASQFMALDLILANVTTGGIILATFLLNLRHMVMSASLSLKLENIKKKWLPLVAFGITDESFSVLSFHEGKLSLPFILALQSSGYFSWLGGTLVGFLVGEVLPKSLQTSLGVGLYAMFISLLAPEIKKSRDVLYLSLMSAIIYIIISYLNIFNSGWDIILGIIISAALGVLILGKDTKEGQ